MDLNTKTRNLLVYRYEYWDFIRGELRKSEKYATFDAILKGCCVPLQDSAMVVQRSGAYSHLVELEELERQLPQEQRRRRGARFPRPLSFPFLPQAQTSNCPAPKRRKIPRRFCAAGRRFSARTLKGERR